LPLESYRLLSATTRDDNTDTINDKVLFTAIAEDAEALQNMPTLTPYHLCHQNAFVMHLKRECGFTHNESLVLWMEAGMIYGLSHVTNEKTERFTAAMHQTSLIWNGICNYLTDRGAQGIERLCVEYGFTYFDHTKEPKKKQNMGRPGKNPMESEIPSWQGNCARGTSRC
jgi:hypothetical protein